MHRYLFQILFLLIIFLSPINVEAQNKTALTITPPLIKNNVNPGQIWKSYLKVVNNSDSSIDVYVQLVNFEAGTETGTVRLAPLTEEEIEGNEYLVNNWINIERGPINIEAFKSKEIPFIVDVPEKADPGDHHVAILVGTQPTGNKKEGSSVKISSMLGSLLLLNVGGEVNESGFIREFTVDKDVYSDGEVNFTLRFQNTGNTILQPRGEIRILDFSEKEQGYVTINHKTNTGNVFPEDVRRWEYTWPVPESLLKMGRYRAELILSYGDKSKEVTESVLYFWVIKFKPVIIFFGSVFFIVLLIVLLVRRYIKKAIMSTQEQLGLSSQNNVQRKVPKAPTSTSQHTVVDLKTGITKPALKTKKTITRKKSAWKMLKRLVIVILLALLLVLAVLLFFYYKNSSPIVVPITEISSENIVDMPNESEEETEKESTEKVDDEFDTGGEKEREEGRASSTPPTEKETVTEDLDKAISIRIQNGSGIAGAASKASDLVEGAGFKVAETANADSFDYVSSVFVYNSASKDEAEFLAESFSVVPEFKLETDGDYDLDIILGSDFK